MPSEGGVLTLMTTSRKLTPRLEIIDHMVGFKFLLETNPTRKIHNSTLTGSSPFEPIDYDRNFLHIFTNLFSGVDEISV